mgnify:CR=1 FL=1
MPHNANDNPEFDPSGIYIAAPNPVGSQPMCVLLENGVVPVHCSPKFLPSVPLHFTSLCSLGKRLRACTLWWLTLW